MTTQQPPADPDPQLRRKATRAIVLYGLARLLLFIVLTAIIQVVAYLISAPLPLVMSALLALIVAFPLSMLLFPRMRMDATATLAQWKQQRKDQKEWVRRELSQR
ncbi:DUF4229 domain-containing protein [Corynebacterium poyangense]|uniref:DUF4229 domain-containing protein n=1 Tax=Corynebacterium poyangense TaxID=2684405 RepID=A0A7H0SLW8_9CORY|nr:DUF4229 domain-containing protein [Corynebacterium poyangense]MBZ8177650.1 DUF4229 domain-containing protein [Corynebacterium poyangense]QNQ89543.1 DUF4229 domain-containing protein [Corynebacterium poyangense]